MSTGSIGMLGYDDDQPQTAWDDAQLWWSNNAQVAGAINEGPVDCSRWGYTIVSAITAAAQGALTFTWFSAQSGGVQLAQRTIMLDQNTLNPTQMVIPNMGPWVSGTFTPQNPVQVWTPTIYALFTNRARPAQAYAQGPFVCNFGTGNIPANGAVTEYLTDIFAGGADLFVDSGNTAITVEVKFLDTTFVYDRIFQGSYAANSRQPFNMLLALSSGLVVVTNTSNTTANTGVIVRLSPNLVGV